MAIADLVDCGEFQALALARCVAVAWWLSLAMVLGACESIGRAVGGERSWSHDVGAAMDEVVREVAGPFWPTVAAVGVVIAGVIRRRRNRRKLAKAKTVPTKGRKR